MDGILNVCKPAGPTSHDVVNRIRRFSGQRKVGHAGTLDPTAAGVLLICLGKATRVIEYMAEYDKQYCAEIVLGFSTDTYDATGRPTSPPKSVTVSGAEVAQALAAFVGPQMQIPPVFSAIKQGGKPLYHRARSGQPVTPPPRVVTIYSMELLAWEAPCLWVDIHCSKGTYVRSIAHDLGQHLGCGGHLRRLVRVATGSYSLLDSVTLEEARDAFAGGYVDSILFPVDEPLTPLPALILNEESSRAVEQGSRHQGPALDSAGHLARAYSVEGRLVAVLEKAPDTSSWQPRKVFTVGA